MVHVAPLIALIFLSWRSYAQSEYLWPTWGGDNTNQQRTPDNTQALLTPNNVINLQEKCQYQSMGSITMYGYITVYKDAINRYNGIFTDFSGFVTNINLDTCFINWRVNISVALQDNNNIYISRNGLSLFRLSDGTEGVLFGTPNGGGSASIMKYAVALHLESGELMWKLPLGNSQLENHGSIHAFMVQGDYAYGGMSSGCNSLFLVSECKFVGRMIKIKMSNDSAEIVDTWHSIPSDKQPLISAPFDRNYYQGAAIWNWPAIIDNYIIFGTGNLYSMPDYVEKCMVGEEISFDNAPFDPCGVDRSNDYIQWRCLEDGIYPSAFNILSATQDENSLSHYKSIPLQGTDVFCGTGDDCTLGAMQYMGLWTSQCYGISESGGDVDLAAVSAYRYDNELYGAGIAKSGMFYSFKIPSGELFLASKIGAWSELGGGQFSFAVSQEYLLGIAHITGGYGIYAQQLADAEFYCGGSIHAIDLRTGKQIYQIANPWSRTGNNCTQQTFGDTGIPISNYVDYTFINSGSCLKGDGDDLSNVNVYKYDISDLRDNDVTVDVEAKATFFAPVTVSGNLLFIPSATGDIFIHDVRNGAPIHILRCDYQPIIFGLGNRRGIRAGVTVIEDRVIYYCGESSNPLLPNGIVHSYQIPSQFVDKN